MADKMTPEQFAYWLQGFAELNEAAPTLEQWKSIREHLAVVFNKVTPDTASLSQIDWRQQICQQQASPTLLTC